MTVLLGECSKKTGPPLDHPPKNQDSFLARVGNLIFVMAGSYPLCMHGKCPLCLWKTNVSPLPTEKNTGSIRKKSSLPLQKDTPFPIKMITP